MNQCEGYGLGLSGLSRYFGYSRDAYYKSRQRQQKRQIDEDQVLRLVHRERHLQPYLSGKKVYHLIKSDLQDQGIKLGRDKLYDLLGRYGLLLQRKRSGVKTTDSRHAWRRYPNLLAQMKPVGPNQAWVCDITYLRTLEGFVYLCLIMDAYSRKIVGWTLHDTLEMEGCLRALDQAIRGLPKAFDYQQLVHHSDQGVQYCCKAYSSVLKAKGIQISMSSKGNCYENAQAERLNGILKQEYGLGQVLISKSKAKRITKQAIELYNYRRPHLSLQMAVPQQVHCGMAQVKVRMCWKKKPKAEVA